MVWRLQLMEWWSWRSHVDAGHYCRPGAGQHWESAGPECLSTASVINCGKYSQAFLHSALTFTCSEGVPGMGTAGSGSVLGGCGWPLGCWTRGRAAGDPIISRVLTEEQCQGDFENPWTLPVKLSSGNFTLPGGG